MGKARNRDADFSLPPSERSTYGATVTVTARSTKTGQTRTFARIEMTAVEAVNEIIDELDLLAGDYRIVTISTPVSIRRDIYASRIHLVGDSQGEFGAPELQMLGNLGRLDMLHPSVNRMSKKNAA